MDSKTIVKLIFIKSKNIELRKLSKNWGKVIINMIGRVDLMDVFLSFDDYTSKGLKFVEKFKKSLNNFYPHPNILNSGIYELGLFDLTKLRYSAYLNYFAVHFKLFKKLNKMMDLKQYSNLGYTWSTDDIKKLKFLWFVVKHDSKYAYANENLDYIYDTGVKCLVFLFDRIGYKHIRRTMTSDNFDVESMFADLVLITLCWRVKDVNGVVILMKRNYISDIFEYIFATLRYWLGNDDMMIKFDFFNLMKNLGKIVKLIEFIENDSNKNKILNMCAQIMKKVDKHDKLMLND